MATERNHIHGLIDKLGSLPPERVVEVEDFIDFLKGRDQYRQHAYAAANVAELSLNKVWDNPDDAVYDSL